MINAFLSKIYLDHWSISLSFAVNAAFKLLVGSHVSTNQHLWPARSVVRTKIVSLHLPISFFKDEERHVAKLVINIPLVWVSPNTKRPCCARLVELPPRKAGLIPKTIGNRKRDCAWGCAGVKKLKKNQLLSTNHQNPYLLRLVMICAQQLIFLQFFNTRASSRTISIYIFLTVFGINLIELFDEWSWNTNE